MNEQELKQYRESDERWAVCANHRDCDTDFQPRRQEEEVCPVCKAGVGYWVDEELDMASLDTYLQEPEEEAEVSPFVDAVWYPLTYDTKEFMDAIGAQLEKVYHLHQGKLYLHTVQHEARDLWGYVVATTLHIDEHDVEDYFLEQIKLEERRRDEDYLAEMDDDEYEEYLKERDNE